MIKFIVAPGEGARSLEYYLYQVKKLSTKGIRRLKHHGTVLVNEKEALLKDMVQDGDIITLYYPPEKMSPYLKAENIALHIIYEDQDILLVNKQAGLCVHPTKSHPGGTLANGVLNHWQNKGGNRSIHIVNRLDKDTSGLVLFAKHYFAAQELFRQQKEDLIKRSYSALVKGFPPSKKGTINLPIEREEGWTIKRKISSEGQRAVTHYQIQKYYQDTNTLQDYTLLKLQLETGRTHQIRVHLQALGFPIVGDPLYGTDSSANNCLSVKSGLNRQFLHADELDFYHPLTGEYKEFKIPLTPELEKYIGRLECLDYL